MHFSETMYRHAKQTFHSRYGTKEAIAIEWIYFVNSLLFIWSLSIIKRLYLSQYSDENSCSNMNHTIYGTTECQSLVR